MAKPKDFYAETVKLKKFSGHRVALDGVIYEEKTQDALHKYKDKDSGNAFFLVPRGKSVVKVEITEDFMENHFPGGEIPENTGGGGRRNRPFVAFDTDGNFIGQYEKQKDFVLDRPEIDLANGLPPVLKGRVRMIKNYHLFYLEEYQAEIEAGRCKEGEFPHALHESYGWEFGKSRRISTTDEAEALLDEAEA